LEINDVTKIDDVAIEGNSAIPTTQIAKAIKIQPGRTVTQKQIKDDVDALIRTRWFASVEPMLRRNEDQVILVFKVRERPLVRSVEYKGLKKIQQNALESITQLKPGSPFDVSSNRECVNRIQEYYGAKGFAFARVELEKGEGIADRDVVFAITEGPKIYVKSIRLFGDPVFIDGDLNNGTPTKSRIISLSAGKPDRSSDNQDPEEIKQYYHQLGYFDVEINERMRVNGDQSKVEVCYDIKEGIRYKVRRFEIAGNTVVPDEVIRKIVEVSEGMPCNMRKIRDHVAAIKSRYDRAGLLLTRIDAIPRWTEDSGQVDVVMRIWESVESPNGANEF
jgi:outer membrane protein insertion porin family